jgi:O-antigen/teichoic acid export membrane protein
MTNYTKKAFFGASITLIFSILASMVAYITRIVLARNLTVEQYGLFYAVFTFVIFFLFFRGLGLDQALVKYIAEYKVSHKLDAIKTSIFSVLTYQLVSSLIFAAFFIIFADYLALNYFHMAIASKMIFFFVIYVIFSIFFITTKHIFQGLQQMALFSSMEFSKNLIVLLLILFFFERGLKIMAPVYAFALVSPILFLVYLPILLKKFDFVKPKISYFNTNTKKLFLFGLPVFATSVGGKIIGYIDTLLLTYFGNLTHVGIYNVVLPSALIFLFFAKAVGSMVFPMSSELWARKDNTRLTMGISMIHKYLFMFTIPLILVIFYYTPFFLDLLFGPRYVTGALAMQILLLGVLVYIIASVNNNLISGIGQPVQVAKIILSSAVLNVILNLILIPKYGIVGAAVATSISYLFMLIYSTRKVCYFLKMKFPLRNWLLLVAPAVIFLWVLSFVEKLVPGSIWVGGVISVPIALVAYIITLYPIANLQDLRKQLKLIKK